MNAQTAYETFVGSISVEGFLDGMTVKQAVEELMQEKWWENLDDDDSTPAPENLADLITQYCELYLEKEAQFD